MIKGSIKKMVEANKPKIKFIPSKNIRVEELKGFFSFRENGTGKIFNAVQYTENSIFVSCFQENFEVVSLPFHHAIVQEALDSGLWELQVELNTVTADQEFFREEAKRLAKENIYLKNVLRNGVKEDILSEKNSKLSRKQMENG